MARTAIKLAWGALDDQGMLVALEDYGSPIDRYEIWMWDTTLRAWGWDGVAGAVHTVSHPLRTFTHSGP